MAFYRKTDRPPEGYVWREVVVDLIALAERIAASRDDRPWVVIREGILRHGVYVGSLN